MPLLLANILASVRVYLADPVDGVNAPFWAEAELLRHANRAVKYIARTNYFRRVSGATSYRNGVFSYANDIIKVYNVWYNGVKLKKTSGDLLASQDASYRTTTGEPEYWYKGPGEEREIRLYPIPEGDALTSSMTIDLSSGEAGGIVVLAADGGSISVNREEGVLVSILADGIPQDLRNAGSLPFGSVSSMDGVGGEGGGVVFVLTGSGIELEVSYAPDISQFDLTLPFNEDLEEVIEHGILSRALTKDGRTESFAKAEYFRKLFDEEVEERRNDSESDFAVNDYQTDGSYI